MIVVSATLLAGYAALLVVPACDVMPCCRRRIGFALSGGVGRGPAVCICRVNFVGEMWRHYPMLGRFLAKSGAGVNREKDRSLPFCLLLLVTLLSLM